MLILASSSPRRQELIRLITDDFLTAPADVCEVPGQYQTPAEYAMRMATAKACQVSRNFNSPVLGADTVVCLGARIYGKPVDMEENVAILRELSGRWHGVITAMALCLDGIVVDSNIVTTRVKFLPLGEKDISGYASSGDGLDKAGGYGIQGAAGKFIAGVDGCYYNVVGLPLAAAADLIRGYI